MEGMPTMREPHPDHPAAGGAGAGSVLFSHAPAALAEDQDASDPVGEDRPWFLPAGELRREHLDGLADVEQDPAGAAAVFARIPLVHRAADLLRYVGEGRQLTSTGALRRADVHALAESWQLDLGELSPTSMWQLDALVGPWNALLSGGWLQVSGTRVRPGEGLVPAVSESADPEGFVRFARAVITLLILDAVQRGRQDGGLFGGPDTFTALLHTIAPGGLLLPGSLKDAIDRDLVPTDSDGAVDMDEVERYWFTVADLSVLASYGLLREEPAPDGTGIRFHGTLEVVIEAFGALEVLSELSTPESSPAP